MEAYREINQETLRHSIQQLPQYQAPPSLWNRIEGNLDGQVSLKKAIEELPVYAPPAQLWAQIEQALDRPQQSKDTGVYRLSGRIRWWAAAAALVGIAAFGWWLVAADAAEVTTFAYSEELQTAPPVDPDWNEEDQIIQEVLQRAGTSAVADQQVVSQLKSEVNELDDARAEIMDMMKRYGEDEQLLKEVARIERARSKVAKQLAVLI